MPEKRGYGQGGSPKKGTIAQRALLVHLKLMVDEAAAKGAGLTRDRAREELKRIRREDNWNTDYILYNVAAKRCRYLRSIGWPVPTSRLFARENDVERITAWSDKERA